MFRQIMFFLVNTFVVHGDKLHEHMTKEEIESIFNVRHDQIHNVEYEVVPIYHKEKRQTNVKLRTFHRNYDLYLEKNGILLGKNTPVFIAKVDNLKKDVIHYKRIPFQNISNIKLYHDRRRRAALAIHKDEDNKIHLDGVIGNDIVIRHIPPRVHNEILSDFPHFVKNSSNNNHRMFLDHQSVNHVIIKPNINDIHGSNISSRFRQNKNIVNVRSRILRNILNSSTPAEDVVYPELLITVDYDTFQNHGSVEVLSKYIAAFWNAVDLRFREMSNPEIRLNIAGLIIPQEKDAAPYFELHEGIPQSLLNAATLLAAPTMMEIGKYFGENHKFRKITYDIVVGMIRRNLGGNRGGKVIRGITGVAAFGGACRIDISKSVALIRDIGGFNGIMTGAHEVAHTMGAPHDGEEIKNISSKSCLSSDGYLMSHSRNNENGLQWSQCSIIAMRNFLRSSRAQCLKNKPDPGKPYPKILPGKLLNRDEQCLRSMGTTANTNNMNNCVILWCGDRTQNRPPAEGTSCGKGMICLDAECVKDPELPN